MITTITRAGFDNCLPPCSSAYMDVDTKTFQVSSHLGKSHIKIIFKIEFHRYSYILKNVTKRIVKKQKSVVIIDASSEIFLSSPDHMFVTVSFVQNAFL